MEQQEGWVLFQKPTPLGSSETSVQADPDPTHATSKMGYFSPKTLALTSQYRPNDGPQVGMPSEKPPASHTPRWEKRTEGPSH